MMTIVCRRSYSALALGSLMLAGLGAIPVSAAEHGGGHGFGGREFGGHEIGESELDRGGFTEEAIRRAPDFHGRDFARFSPSERDEWTLGGRWIHDWHDGRYGWWWLVGDYWYLYPEAVYPYPTYIPVTKESEAPPAPPGVLAHESWYFCSDPQGYYPYVASCNVSWREVPMTPPPGSVAAHPATPTSPLAPDPATLSAR